MKKVMAMLVVLCLTLSLTACVPTPTPSAAPSQAEKKTITIAYDFAVLDVTFTKIWEGMQAAAAEYNAANPNTEVKLIMTNADGKVDKQITNVESLIVQKPDVIMVICVDSIGSIPAIQAVKNAGIKCVNGFKLADTDLADVNLEAVDNYLLGKLQAEWLDKYMQANPDANLKIGYLNSDPALPAAQVRYNGFKENFLDKYASSGRATEVANTYAFWTTDKAMTVVEDWLQANPDLNCVVAMSDLMALGAVNVANSANKEILILGMDGIPDALAAVKSGDMAMTTLMDKPAMIKDSVDVCIKLALGEQVDKEQNLAKSTITIDSTNIGQILP